MKKTEWERKEEEENEEEKKEEREGGREERVDLCLLTGKGAYDTF